MANSVTRELIIAEARRRGGEVSTFGLQAEFCRITYPDGRVEIFQGSRPMASSANGRMIAITKNMSMEFVQALGFNVLPFTLFSDMTAAEKFLQLHSPIVAKPNDAERGVGVTVGITDRAQLKVAIDHAIKHSFGGTAVLQKQATGTLCRLLVINGKFVAAALRTHPEVIGDGMHTVKELIIEKNKDPRRIPRPNSVLRKIDLEGAEALLGENMMNRILEKNETVKVAAIESVTVGGETINVTSKVHKTWQDAAVEITQATGLFICGFDVMCEGISQPRQVNELPLLEINSMPALKIHQYPTAGEPAIDVTSILFDELSKQYN